MIFVASSSAALTFKTISTRVEFHSVNVVLVQLKENYYQENTRRKRSIEWVVFETGQRRRGQKDRMGFQECIFRHAAAAAGSDVTMIFKGSSGVLFILKQHVQL